MLQRSIDRHPPQQQAYASARMNQRVQGDFDGDAVAGVLRNLRRNARLIMLSAIAGTLIATAAVFSMTPLYKATTLVLVDPRQTKILQDAEVVGRPGTESGAIDSEAEMVTSPAVLRAVAEKMHLENDDEFAGITGILAAIKAYLIAPIKRLFGAKGSSDPYGAVVDKLAKYSSAKRRALSYVIELNAWSRDPGKAMNLANTIADQYLAQQVASKAKVTERATEWLNGRVEELRQRVDKSDRALEQYKAQAGLFDPAGENLSDRQIASLNDQLVDSRAKAAAARAKYDQLKQITPRELRSAAATPDVLQSPVISNLRGQYADAARKLAEKTARYGPQNPIVTSAHAEAGRLESEITAEINRIISSSKAEYEIAKSREESLEASLDDLKEKGSKFNEAMVRMHELEREAQANRDLFNSFLARAKQTAELNFQVPDSRVVSEATMPNSTSYPRRALIIGVAFFGSLGLGIAIALARGVFARGFRNTSDIETTLGLQSLASIPLIEGSVRPSHGREPFLGNMRGARLSLPGPGTNSRASSRDRLAAARKLASLVIDRPNSPFSESVRALRFNIRHSLNDVDENTVLVTSALAGEGKSTIAANLAREAALSGERVLLLDADLRCPTLANSLEFQPREGAPAELSDILLGYGDFRRSIRRDRKSGLYVVAGTTRVSGAEAVALLSSQRMQELIDISRKAFDLVIIDAPPLLHVTDAALWASQVDGVVLLVNGGSTKKEQALRAKGVLARVQAHLLGAVLLNAE